MKVWIVALLIACGDKPTPPPPTGTRIGPALVAAMDAAGRVVAPWRCAAMDAPGLADTTITAGKRTWKLAGHALTTTRTRISIGFVADAGGAAPPTLAALGRLRAKLGDVDLVVALGGMGTTRAELEGTLGAIAGDAPLVAMPGDLEAAPALSEAVRALAAKRPVVDGRLVRRIELPNATIATLAGTSAASRLVAGAEGCAVRPDDVDAMFAAMSSRLGLRILASVEAPRMRIEGEPVGERSLVASGAQQLDVVVHGAGTRATAVKSGGRDGLGVALSPGASDATTRLPARGVPSAGILTIDEKTWRWRTVTDDVRP